MARPTYHFTNIRMCDEETKLMTFRVHPGWKFVHISNELFVVFSSSEREIILRVAFVRAEI